MAFWAEMLLKAFVLMTAIFSLAVACIVAMIMISGGGALGPDSYSWKASVFGAVLGVSHCALIVAGCRAGWEFVDEWSAARKQRI